VSPGLLRVAPKDGEFLALVYWRETTRRAPARDAGLRSGALICRLLPGFAPRHLTWRVDRKHLGPHRLHGVGRRVHREYPHLDSFSKQRLFQAAWQQLYPGLLEWVSLSNGGKVTSVDPATRTLVTDFASYKADVANVIPPQRAGRIADIAGVSDRSGWCPIDPVTFESRLQPGIHVIGDAAIAGAMPKSAFAANAQAKVCAAAVVALLRDHTPSPPKLINTCYSLIAPDYGISIAGVYHPVNGQLADVEGVGGVSPVDAPADFRALEASYAAGWFRTITAETFG
jgi:sulfide dehydrogenase [flavocytochrome c] flavoprotein chain